jgi:DNA polymerase-3 subunit gamma/tau
VLATTEPHKLLPTIVSRCQKFDFSLVSAQDMCRLLEHIASREGIQVEAEAVGMIAEHAHGSVRDAIGVMDQIANLSGELITKEQLAEMLGEVETDLVFEMVDLIAERDTPGTLTCVGNLVEDGKDPRQFVEALIGHLRSLFLVQNAANPSEIVEATDEHFARLVDQAGRLKRHEVVRLMERLGEAHREMRWSESPRLILECALVKITSLDADATLEGLAFRIDELERKLASLGGADIKPPAAAPRPAPAEAQERKTGKKTPPREAKKPAPKEDAVERAVKAATEAPAATPARTDGASAGERERDRRAWMAVLAELKKTGQMKLWTLLAKARVISSGDGELVLGFGEECAFQMEALTASPGLEKVAELWERFVGQPVKVELTLAAARVPRAAEEPPPTTVEPAAAGPVEDPLDEPSEIAPEPEEAVPPRGGVEESESVEPAGKKSSAEIARIFKERFDGEIIDKTKEGKD